MKPEDIHINDWQRMLIGNVPGGFYLEVIFRTGVIYLILMVSMRLMGKRMASQLSRNEMIAMVSLAAAIGVPLQSPERGILAAVVIAAIVVTVQQLLAGKISEDEKFETLTQGNVTVLIEDGHLNLENMKESGVTRERAFSQMRNNGIKHLGQVKRLYFEAGGAFSLIRNREVGPGLGVLPDYDEKFKQQEYRFTEELVCKNCGQLGTSDHPYYQTECQNCRSRIWMKAVL
jgi:uncharacterized membrane protein YcaP (DUF421 family)